MTVTKIIADYGVAIGITIIAVGLVSSFFYKYIQRLDKKFDDDREEKRYERDQKAKHDELVLEAEKDKLEAEQATRKAYLSMTEELKNTTQAQSKILESQSVQLQSYSDSIDGNTKAIEEHNRLFEEHIQRTGDRFDCVDRQLVSIAGMLDEIRENTKDLATKADLEKVKKGLDEYIRSKQ
nr:MAG TPA: Selenoprotein S (SelS) [Caudoviricetes sp.]